MLIAVPPETTLRHLTIDQFGGPEELRVVSRGPLPEPGRGEVLIAVEAASVQFTDTVIRRGLYHDAGPAPLTPGYDVVGRVHAVGEGVEPWTIGDRVADLTKTGGCATHIVRASEGLVRVPDSLDPAEATALSLSGVTAYQMLFRQARVRPGHRVLVQGGNGGVGWFALQLLAARGITTWTTARPAHHAALRALGAHPVDYRDPTWPRRVREASEGGVDFVFDGQGARGFRDSLHALRRKGRLVIIGSSAAVQASRTMTGSIVGAMLRNLNPFGPRVGMYSITETRKRRPAAFREDLAELLAMLERGELNVRIDRRIGFDGVARAHADLEAGGVSGKIVLLPS
ncbi:MAG: medium chain dehydrogenase/reductase family protein [Myxococcota bacterium]